MKSVADLLIFTAKYLTPVYGTLRSAVYRWSFQSYILGQVSVEISLMPCPYILKDISQISTDFGESLTSLEGMLCYSLRGSWQVYISWISRKYLHIVGSWEPINHGFDSPAFWLVDSKSLMTSQTNKTVGARRPSGLTITPLLLVRYHRGVEKCCLKGKWPK